MPKKYIILIGILLGLGVVFSWFSSLPASPKVPKTPENIGWRTIQKTQNGWERGAFQEGDDSWKSFQEGTVLLYGKGPNPSIDIKKRSIIIPSGGMWFVRSLDPRKGISITTTFTSGEMQYGSIFIDDTKKIIMNFDADLTVGGVGVGPSFLYRDNTQEFFDIAEQGEILGADIWGIYTAFLPRDQKYVLGSADKKAIDAYIETALLREPVVDESSTFPRDNTVRIRLEETKNFLQKIESEEACGSQPDTCFILLDEVQKKGVERFPEVFEPLQKYIQNWVKSKKTEKQIALSWREIFATYHDDIVAANPRAVVIRDNAVLQMIRTNQTDATYEVWGYLTNMLSKQKLGSAYSLQIMREMIRIGDVLNDSPTINTQESANLRKTAMEALKNLNTLLESTYFTKKDYLFILRNDLVDSSGKSIQTRVFTDDLQSLVKQVERSTLFDVNIKDENSAKVQTIRGQLTWFNCILSNNQTYIKNPRICRTLLTQ